jgi:hypothetical protein
MHSHFPQLGIFYVINEDLYMESIQTIEGEDWGGIQNVSKRAHAILGGTDETAQPTEAPCV